MAQRYERKRKKRRRKTNVSAYDRLAWAKAEFEKNPLHPIQGGDGIVCRMMELFGSAATTDQLHALRTEVRVQKSKTNQVSKDKRDQKHVQSRVNDMLFQRHLQAALFCRLMPHLQR